MDVASRSRTSTAEVHPPVSSAIPHAEVWTPSRSMLNNTLPIPATDSASLRKLLATGRRRHETTAIREIWKARKGQSARAMDSMLGQYKQMLNARMNSQQGPESSHPEPRQKSPSDIKKRYSATGPGGVSRSRMLSRSQSVPNPRNIQKREKVKSETSNEEAKTKQLESNDGKESKPAKQQSRHLTSYNEDFVQKIGMTSLPKIPIRTLSADWWSEIQKRPMTRMRYSEPVRVDPDCDKIERALIGKYFIKNSTQTYFQATVPKHLHTYNIHPEFGSEYLKCW